MDFKSPEEWSLLLVAVTMGASGACGGKTNVDRHANETAGHSTTTDTDGGSSHVAAAGSQSTSVADGAAGFEANGTGGAEAGASGSTDASAGMGGLSGAEFAPCPDAVGQALPEQDLPTEGCPAAPVELSPRTCELSLPVSPDSTLRLDYDAMRLLYTPDPDEPEMIRLVPRLDGSGECSLCGGWSFDWSSDEPDKPPRVVLCPCACSALRTGALQWQWPCWDHGLL